MEALLFDLQPMSAKQSTVQHPRGCSGGPTSCDRAACLANRPGAEKAKAFGLRSPLVGAFLSLGFRCGRFACSDMLSEDSVQRNAKKQAAQTRTVSRFQNFVLAAAPRFRAQGCAIDKPPYRYGHRHARSGLRRGRAPAHGQWAPRVRVMPMTCVLHQGRRYLYKHSAVLT
jgi:hypothetical protein